jgi:hypothetical protein
VRNGSADVSARVAVEVQVLEVATDLVGHRRARWSSKPWLLDVVLEDLLLDLPVQAAGDFVW